MAFSFYRFYGLLIQSDLALPFLQAVIDPDRPVDCRIWFEREGPLPPPFLPFDTNDTWEFDPSFLQRSEVIRREEQKILLTRSVILTRSINQQYTCLSYVDGAAFVINKDATDIWVTAPADASFEYLTGYLFSTVASYLLHRKRYLCLHASGLILGDNAVLFAGDSGAGKSTIVAYFALRGYPVVTDDIAPLIIEGGNYYVVPSYPMVRLRPATTSALMGSENALPYLAEDWHKQFLDLRNKADAFPSAPVKLQAIYLLAGRAPAPTITRLPPTAALIELTQSTYLGGIMSPALRMQEFSALAQLAGSVPVYSLNPPDMDQFDVLHSLLVPSAVIL